MFSLSWSGPNLTVLTGALVTRLALDGSKATGVEFAHNGTLHRVGAASEVVLSLGAINTPKVLMQSGIGDHAELQRHGIPVVQHLSGVGRNLQDHVGFDCVWEYERPMPPRNTAVEATFFWTSDAWMDCPDIQTVIQHREHQTLQSPGGGMEPLRWSRSAEKPRRNPVDRSQPTRSRRDPPQHVVPPRRRQRRDRVRRTVSRSR